MFDAKVIERTRTIYENFKHLGTRPKTPPEVMKTLAALKAIAEGKKQYGKRGKKRRGGIFT